MKIKKPKYKMLGLSFLVAFFILGFAIFFAGDVPVITKLFYPAMGRQYYFKYSGCLAPKFGQGTRLFLENEDRCNYLRSHAKGTIVEVNSTVFFTVDRIEITGLGDAFVPDNPGFGTHSIVTETKLGQIILNGKSLFEIRWSNGDSVLESDLTSIFR